MPGEESNYSQGTDSSQEGAIGKSVTIELEPDDGEGDGGSGESRQDRRNQRRDDLVRESREKAEEAERRARAAEDRANDFEARYNRDISEIRQQMSQRQPVPQDQPDDVQKKWDEIYDKREHVWERVRLLGDKVTQEDIDKAQKESRRLEFEAIKVVTSAAPQTRQQQVDPTFIANQVRFGDVLNDPTLRGVAQSAALMEMAERGLNPAQMSPEQSAQILQNSIEKAREWRDKRGGKPKPRKEDQSRFSGRSVGGSTTGSGSSISVPASEIPRMQRNADTLYHYINSSPESQARFGHKDDGAKLRLQKYLKRHQNKK